MVGVLFANDRALLPPGNAVFCSGSLISEHEFLTAAHCTQVLTQARISHYRVSFDEQLSLSADLVVQAENSIAVTGWATHPGFHTPPTAWNPGSNDVGVIHLDPTVEVDATPVDLPEVGFLDEEAAQNGLNDHEFTNVGYGLYSDFFTLGPSRRVSVTPFMALTSYALDQFGGTTAGDSGGPHFFGGDYPNLEVATTSSGSRGGGLVQHLAAARHTASTRLPRAVHALTLIGLERMAPLRTVPFAAATLSAFRAAPSTQVRSNRRR